MNLNQITRIPIHGEEARSIIQDAIQELAQAVSTTLGPAGQNVVIEYPDGGIHVTKDGVTVAKNFMTNDHLKNIGVKMIQQASIFTGDRVGDGTTTSTVIAAEMIKLLSQKIQDSKINVNKVAKYINELVSEIVKDIEENESIPVKTIEDLNRISMISSNNDNTIMNLINDAYSKIGMNGIVIHERSSTNQCTISVTEGMEINKGWISPYFVNDIPSNSAIYEDVVIVITEDKITNITEYFPLLEWANQKGKAVLIIADNVEQSALKNLVANRIKSRLQVVAIQAPAFGERRSEILEDIAILTGTKVYSKKNGVPFTKQIEPDRLGKCKKIIVSDKSTIINGGQGDKNSLAVRINQLKAKVEKITESGDENENWTLEKIKDRLAKLESGVATIRIGANTEIEMNEKIDRMDDALRAVKAAIESGYVEGGGYTLLKAHRILIGKQMETDSLEFKIAIEAIRESIIAPYKKILSNAGYEPELINDFVEQCVKVDAYENNVIDDYISSGIIDPTKVVVMALQNAASVATMFITTDCMLAINQEK